MTSFQPDYHRILKKLLSPRLRLKSNLHLVIRAVEMNYDVTTIEQLLALSPQTQVLSDWQVRQNHRDCLAFARTIVGNYNNGENYRLRVFPAVEDSVSLNKIFFCIFASDAIDQEEKARFNLVLQKYNLAAYYYTTRRILVIHDADDINVEYLCAHQQKVQNYGNGWIIHIITDNLLPELKLKLWQEYRSIIKPGCRHEYYLRLVLRLESRYCSELVEQAKIAETNSIIPNDRVDIVREYFEVVNPDWRSHLQQMEQLGIKADYWLTVCVRENERELVERAIAIYQQKTLQRNFVRNPIAYWRYILNSLNTVEVYNGFRNDCPAGNWRGIVVRKAWGRKNNIQTFLALDIGNYFFNEYANNNYTPRMGKVNLARVEIGQSLKIETEVNVLGYSRIVKARLL